MHNKEACRKVLDRVKRILFMVITAVILLACHTAEAKEVGVVLIPFDVYAEKDISPLRKEVMETLAEGLEKEGVKIRGMESIKELFIEGRLKELTDEQAIGLARDEGAGFVIKGAITLIGERFSLDMFALDTTDGRFVAFYHKKASSSKALIAGLEENMPELKERLELALQKIPVERSGIVTRIVVEGNRRIDADAILKRVSTKVGEPFSTDKVKEDIHSIYGMGYFDDIVVDLSDYEGGKQITFIVREKPLVKKIEFRGNRNIKEERLRETITLKENTILDRMLIKENVQIIKALYNQEGYYLAEVKEEITGDGVGVTVVFNITEGEQVKVKRITIIGNSVLSDRKIKRLMKTKEKGVFSFITGSGTFNEYVFEDDLSGIIRYYLDHGYIKADITDYRVLLSEDKRWFYITMAIDEGAQYRVGKIDVSGDMIFSREEILEKFKFSTGDTFSRRQLHKTISALTTLYGDRGYANAEFNPVTHIDDERKTIDITLKISMNVPVYVERIEISGNIRTRDKVIRRELEFSEGDLYSASALRMSRNNLRRLGYFEEVRIERSEGSTRDRIRIHVKVKERPTGMITFGMGYSSVDKVIVMTSISQANFMGTGIKLNLSGNISATSSRYMISFTEPWLFDKPYMGGFDLYNTYRDYPDFSMDKNGGVLRFGFPIYKRITTGYLTYRYEKVEITDVAETTSTIIKEQEGVSTVSSVKALLRHDSRDDFFFPTEGTVATASVEVAGGIVGGNTNYAKYEASAGRYFPMPKETTLMTRLTIGYVHSFGGKKVPVYERYFLGGMNSIRGFDTRSIGPKDHTTGEVIGGKSMLISNTEYLFPLFPENNFMGLVFFDAGNAYEGPIDPSTLKTTAGAGVRWYSPIGPIRLEWGYNLNRKEDEEQSAWGFTIGGFF